MQSKKMIVLPVALGLTACGAFSTARGEDTEEGLREAQRLRPKTIAGMIAPFDTTDKEAGEMVRKQAPADDVIELVLEESSTTKPFEQLSERLAEAAWKNSQGLAERKRVFE